MIACFVAVVAVALLHYRQSNYENLLFHHARTHFYSTFHYHWMRTSSFAFFLSFSISPVGFCYIIFDRKTQMAKQYKECENISILHHNNPIRPREGQWHSPTSSYILQAEEPPAK